MGQTDRATNRRSSVIPHAVPDKEETRAGIRFVQVFNKLKVLRTSTTRHADWLWG